MKMGPLSMLLTFAFVVGVFVLLQLIRGGKVCPPWLRARTLDERGDWCDVVSTLFMLVLFAIAVCG